MSRDELAALADVPERTSPVALRLLPRDAACADEADDERDDVTDDDHDERDERDEAADDAHADDAHADELSTDAPDDATRPDRGADWYTALVRAHQRDVFRFLVRRAGQDADDLTADVLTIAWRRRADVPEGAELPWLYRTAGYVLANHRRKGRPVPVEHLPETVDDDDPALRAVHDEQVRTALAALSPRDRKIVLLNAWEGLTGQALADVLGIGRGGADAALSRARSRLAAAWAASSDDQD